MPLHQPVTVLRDSWGIPHIYAADQHDLMVALGFVHAPDRLWQMERARRTAEGRLSEILGESALETDKFMRLLGLTELRDEALDSIPTELQRLLEAYVSGVNSYLRVRGDDLPPEFQTVDLVPEPWEVKDVFAPLVLDAWYVHQNYREEVFAVLAADRLELSYWDLLFPSYPGARLPEDQYFERIGDLKIAPFQDVAVTPPSGRTPHGGGGSNNWVIAEGSDGMPILANDPHLGPNLPGRWCFCDLTAPDMRVAGATFAGTPSIIIGHNAHVAGWRCRQEKRSFSSRAAICGK